MAKKQKGKSKSNQQNSKTDSTAHAKTESVKNKSSEKVSKDTPMEKKDKDETQKMIVALDSSEDSNSQKISDNWESSPEKKYSSKASYSSNVGSNSKFGSRPLRCHKDDEYANNRKDSNKDKRRSQDSVTERRKETYYGRRSEPFSSSRALRKSKNIEFDKYEEEFRLTRGKIEFVRVAEIERDLFQMDKEYSLAHCVAEDMNMGSGIAVQFRRDFKRVDELLNQRQKKGGLAILKDGDRFIYYLVTKQYSTGKPTYFTLFSSLQKLREHIEENEITKVAMPRIGCGLDRLQWEEVKYMIEYIFRNVDIKIIICNLVQTDEDSPPSRHINCRMTSVTYPIEEIEAGTIIIYLSTEDGYISEEMTKLDKKFNFLLEFRKSRKQMDDVVYFTRNENYMLCGCIVRPKETDPINYRSFQRCVNNIQKVNSKQYMFGYVGFQAIKDRHDDIATSKIINILRNTLRGVEVYVCWIGDMQNEMLARERSSDYNQKTNLQSSRLDWRLEIGADKREDDANGRGTKRGNNLDFGGGAPYSSNSNHSSASTSQFDNDIDEAASFENRSITDYNLDEQNDNDGWFHCHQKSDDFKEHGGRSSSKTRGKSSWPKGPRDGYDGPITPTKKSKTSDDENVGKQQAYKEQKTHQRAGISDNIEKNRKVSISKNEELAKDMVNHEFERYEEKRNNLKESSIVTEVDVNGLPERHSRACYVTEALGLESGVPYGLTVKELLGKCLNENKKEGDVAVVDSDNNYLYCLVIKQTTSPPRREKVFSAIQKMRDHAHRNKVRHIVIPTMKNTEFDWSEVKPICEFLFGKRGPTKVIMSAFDIIPSSKTKIDHSKSGIHQIKKKSIILYWASEDGYISEEMNSLDKTFKLIENFRRCNKIVGNTIQYKQNDDYILYGCIVKKKYSDPYDFVAMQECILTVNNNNKTNPMKLIAVQAVDDSDEVVNHKIITVLKTFLENVTIRVCWPGHLKEKMPTK